MINHPNYDSKGYNFAILFKFEKLVPDKYTYLDPTENYTLIRELSEIIVGEACK